MYLDDLLLGVKDQSSLFLRRHYKITIKATKKVRNCRFFSCFSLKDILLMQSKYRFNSSRFECFNTTHIHWPIKSLLHQYLGYSSKPRVKCNFKGDRKPFMKQCGYRIVEEVSSWCYTPVTNLFARLLPFFSRKIRWFFYIKWFLLLILVKGNFFWHRWWYFSETIAFNTRIWNILADPSSTPFCAQEIF